MLSDSAATCGAYIDARFAHRWRLKTKVTIEPLAGMTSWRDGGVSAVRRRTQRPDTYRTFSDESIELVGGNRKVVHTRSRRLRCYYRRDITLRNAISWRTSVGELHEATDRSAGTCRCLPTATFSPHAIPFRGNFDPPAIILRIAGHNRRRVGGLALTASAPSASASPDYARGELKEFAFRAGRARLRF